MTLSYQYLMEMGWKTQNNIGSFVNFSRLCDRSRMRISRKAQMIMTLRGRALDWYMKFSIVPIGFVPTTLNGIQVGLIDEFRNPKSKSHYITEIKEIKQPPIEFAWDFDQIFKTLMAKVSFQMLDVQHK